MASRPAVKVRPITRDKLATFLGSHELITAFENLVEDVATTIPDDTETLSIAVDAAQETADGAIVSAAAARSVAELLRPLVEALVAGPPPAPAARAEPEGLPARLAQLESTVARLARRVNQLEEGPPP